MGIRNTILGIRAEARHRVRFFWPDQAEFSISKVFLCIALGIGTSVFVMGRVCIDVRNLYLWSAFGDPLFQNKLFFGITFSITILAGSFSAGYIVLEFLQWIVSKARQLYRSSGQSTL